MIEFEEIWNFLGDYNVQLVQKMDITDILDYVKDCGSGAGADLMLLVGYNGVEFDSEVFDALYEILRKDAQR